MGVLLVAAVGSYAGDAAAQQGDLSHAEQAFLNLEYERAREAAQEALDGGGLSQADTARAYELIGTASAFLDELPPAYEAYRRFLAISPGAEMDRSLPPHLRTPFLEARGWWAAQRNQLGATMSTLNPGGDQLLRFIVGVQDPLDMAEEVALNVRGTDEGSFQTHRAEADARITLTSAALGLSDEALQGPELEYYVELLDARGNVVHSRGTASDPQQVNNPLAGSSAVGGGGSGGATTPSGPQVWEEWWFWTIIVGVVAAGVAVGVYFAIPPEINGRVGVRF